MIKNYNNLFRGWFHVDIYFVIYFIFNHNFSSVLPCKVYFQYWIYSRREKEREEGGGGRRGRENEKGERGEAGRIGTRGRVGRSDGIKRDSNGTDTFFRWGISIRKVNRDLSEVAIFSSVELNPLLRRVESTANYSDFSKIHIVRLSCNNFTIMDSWQFVCLIDCKITLYILRNILQSVQIM